MIRASAWLGAVLALAIGSAAAETPAAPFRIGLILSSSAVSQEIANGLTLAFDESGPLAAGRPVAIVRADSSGRPEAALEHARRLVAVERADVLVGPVTSSEALALRDFAEERRIPLIVPEASTNRLTGARCSKFVFRVSYANDQIATALAGYLAAGRKLRRAYMISGDDQNGHDMLEAFRRAFEAAGGEVVGETYVPRGAADVAPYLAKMRLTGADVAFAHFAGPAAERFLSAYHDLGLRASIKLAGSGWLVSPFHRTEFKLDTVAGAIGATNYLPDADAGVERRFVRKYAERFGHLPSEHAAHGYDAGRLILAALADLEGRAIDGPMLARALATVPFEGARGATRLDPATHNVVQDIHIVKNMFAANAAAGAVGALSGAPLARVPAVAAPSDSCRMPSTTKD